MKLHKCIKHTRNYVTQSVYSFDNAMEMVHFLRNCSGTLMEK